MGKIRFGNAGQVTPVKPNTWPPELMGDVEVVNYTNNITEYVTVPAEPEYIEIEKIVYVDKPVEVIKEVKVIEYVEKEVIVEKPIEVIKTVEVVKYVDKEVIVEKPVEVIRELEVPNKLNKYMVAVIVALGAIIILQGLL